MQEVASQTIGSSPPSLQRHSASIVWLAIRAGAELVSLRRPGRRAAMPGDVRRDPQRQAGARRHRHQRLGEALALGARPAGAAEDPVDAGRHVDGGGPRAIRLRQPSRRRVRHVARPLGERARSSAPAASPGSRRASRARATRPALPAPRLVRAARSAASQRPASRSASRCERSPCWRSRRPLTNLPVSMPTGQASRQVPSAAQVCSASYSNSSSSDRRAPGSRAPGGPSRGAARSAGGASWSGAGSGRRARRSRTRRRCPPRPRPTASS